MSNIKLPKDPYNIIITGVGGQGNVMASRMLGNMLVRNGYYVTIGETFGASQRGGSVASHLRISKESIWSPQTPKGNADFIIALEPTESIRLLVSYGNPGTKVLSNTRPIYSVGVIAGDLSYPDITDLKNSIVELTSEAFFIDATEKAVELGKPIFANIIMIGALAGTGILTISKEDFSKVLSDTVSPGVLDLNLKAFEIGESQTRAEPA